MNRLESAILALALVLLPLAPEVVAAQSAAGEIGGLRAYWHVFIAYTIAIALVLGWVVSIARRLRDVEERLGRG